SRKKYGLVWEPKDEDVIVRCKEKFPILTEVESKDIYTNSNDLNILIEGDNYHALSVLNYTHKGKIDLIYADPPYNTGNKSWRYNNDYVEKDDAFRHSKWLSFMYRRISLARNLLKDDGIFVLTIDDYELFTIGLLLDEVFGEDNKIGIVAIETNPRGRTTNTFFATSHEYILFYAKNATKASLDLKDLTDEQANAFNLEDEISKYRLLPFRRSGGLSTREERPNSFYPIYFNPVTGEISIEKIKEGVEILPIDTDGRERVWRQTRPSLMVAVKRGDIVIKSSGKKYTVLMKDRIKDGRKAKTIWVDPKYDASSHGTVLIQKMLEKRKVFDYPKSLYAVIDTLNVLIKSKKQAIVLDFFAGSGTTGHAILELNKSDEGSRKFILCTNNENKIAEEVCYQRIKKAIKGWNDKGEKISGLGGNLKYYKTDFIDAEQTDKNKKKLVDKSTEMLCLKEDCFEELKKDKSFMVFTNTADKYMAVIYDEAGIEPFKTYLTKLNKKTMVYMFSL
ncbi:MAG TPA: site-specific DNA-methyltransferase, partial [Clostridia bacterium]